MIKSNGHQRLAFGNLADIVSPAVLVVRPVQRNPRPHTASVFAAPAKSIEAASRRWTNAGTAAGLVERHSTAIVQSKGVSRFADAAGCVSLESPDDLAGRLRYSLGRLNCLGNRVETRLPLADDAEATACVRRRFLPSR